MDERENEQAIEKKNIDIEGLEQGLEGGGGTEGEGGGGEGSVAALTVLLF